MNAIYRVIYNAVKGVWVCTSELTRAHGKRTLQRDRHASPQNIASSPSCRRAWQPSLLAAAIAMTLGAAAGEVSAAGLAPAPAPDARAIYSGVMRLDNTTHTVYWDGSRTLPTLPMFMPEPSPSPAQDNVVALGELVDLSTYTHMVLTGALPSDTTTFDLSPAYRGFPYLVGLSPMTVDIALSADRLGDASFAFKGPAVVAFNGGEVADTTITFAPSDSLNHQSASGPFFRQAALRLLENTALIGADSISSLTANSQRLVSVTQANTLFSGNQRPYWAKNLESGVLDNLWLSTDEATLTAETLNTVGGWIVAKQSATFSGEAAKPILLGNDASLTITDGSTLQHLMVDGAATLNVGTAGHIDTLETFGASTLRLVLPETSTFTFNQYTANRENEATGTVILESTKTAAEWTTWLTTLNDALRASIGEADPRATPPVPITLVTKSEINDANFIATVAQPSYYYTRPYSRLSLSSWEVGANSSLQASSLTGDNVANLYLPALIHVLPGVSLSLAMNNLAAETFSPNAVIVDGALTLSGNLSSPLNQGQLTVNNGGHLTLLANTALLSAWTLDLPTLNDVTWGENLDFAQANLNLHLGHVSHSDSLPPALQQARFEKISVDALDDFTDVNRLFGELTTNSTHIQIGSSTVGGSTPTTLSLAKPVVVKTLTVARDTTLAASDMSATPQLLTAETIKVNSGATLTLTPSSQLRGGNDHSLYMPRNTTVTIDVEDGGHLRLAGTLVDRSSPGDNFFYNTSADILMSQTAFQEFQASVDPIYTTGMSATQIFWTNKAIVAKGNWTVNSQSDMPNRHTDFSVLGNVTMTVPEGTTFTTKNLMINPGATFFQHGPGSLSANEIRVSNGLLHLEHVSQYSDIRPTLIGVTLGTLELPSPQTDPYTVMLSGGSTLKSPQLLSNMSAQHPFLPVDNIWRPAYTDTATVTSDLFNVLNQFDRTILDDQTDGARTLKIDASSAPTDAKVTSRVEVGQNNTLSIVGDVRFAKALALDGHLTLANGATATLLSNAELVLSEAMADPADLAKLTLPDEFVLSTNAALLTSEAHPNWWTTDFQTTVEGKSVQLKSTAAARIDATGFASWSVEGDGDTFALALPAGLTRVATNAKLNLSTLTSGDISAAQSIENNGLVRFGAATIAGQLKGASPFEKVGDGVATITTNEPDWVGRTTVKEGTLKLMRNAGLAGNIAVERNAAFYASAESAAINTLRLHSLMASSTPAALTHSNSLTFSDGSFFEIDALNLTDYSRHALTANLTIGSGVQLKVHLGDGWTADAVGSTLANVLTWGGYRTGSFSGLIEIADNPTIGFQPVYVEEDGGAGHMDLKIVGNADGMVPGTSSNNGGGTTPPNNNNNNNGETTTPTTPETPTTPVQPSGGSRLVPAAESLGNMTLAQMDAWRSQINDVNKRLGDLRTYGRDKAGAWARYYGGTTKVRSSDARTKADAVQAGVDVPVGDMGYVGITGLYSDGDSRTSMGRSDDRGYGFGVYGGIVAQSGLFVDAIAKAYRISSDVSLMIGDRPIEGNYAAWGTSIALETGWRLPLTDRFWVEPQVELTYGRLDGDSYRTATNALVTQKSINSLVGRAGTAFGARFSSGSAYVKASVAHEWKATSEATIERGTESASQEQSLAGTWGEFALGGTYNATPAFSFYGEVQTNYGSKLKSPVLWTVGARYAF